MWRQQTCGYLRVPGGVVRQRPCASYLAGGLVEGKVARHNGRVLLAAGNSGKNGRGIFVGFLQQNQITRGVRPGN